jgi:HJR/Mrr/RecB family endonuclease
MNWLAQHIVLSTSTIVALGILSIVLTLRFVPKLVGERMAGPASSITFSLVIGILFSVFLNNIYAVKRDLENRIWSAMQKHLEQIRPVLKADADDFERLSKKIYKDGSFTEPFATEREFKDSYGQIWKDNNPLASDLDSHFQDYAKERSEVRTELSRLDNDEKIPFEEVDNELKSEMTFQGSRTQVAFTILQNMLGFSPIVKLDTVGNSYSYVLGNYGGNSGGGPAPSEYVENIQVYKSFRITATQIKKAEVLRKRSDKLAERMHNLGIWARRLSENGFLSGQCVYLPTI